MMMPTTSETICSAGCAAAYARSVRSASRRIGTGCRRKKRSNGHVTTNKPTMPSTDSWPKYMLARATTMASATSTVTRHVRGARCRPAASGESRGREIGGAGVGGAVRVVVVIPLYRSQLPVRFTDSREIEFARCAGHLRRDSARVFRSTAPRRACRRTSSPPGRPNPLCD